ncbi:hypothetical protein BH23GEM6_BH23GEM6_18990 [soil metagenome]
MVIAPREMRAFIDTLGPLWQEGKLANKVVTAMTSASNPHGGQETTLQTLYYTFMHWGAIIITPGYTDESVFATGGNPYGVSVTADGNPLSDEVKKLIRYQTQRVLETTSKLIGAGS